MTVGVDGRDDDAGLGRDDDALGKSAESALCYAVRLAGKPLHTFPDAL
jgi:hypothetical protein